MAKNSPIVDASTFSSDTSQIGNKPVAANPPPQKPPETSTQTATSNLFPKSAKEFFVLEQDPIFMPTFQDLKKKGPVSNKQLLNLFKVDPVNFIKELNRPQNNLERERLQNLINKTNLLSKDQGLYNAWQTAKAYIPDLREKSLILTPEHQPKTQTQPQTSTAPETPITTAEQITQAKPAVTPPKGNKINSENAPKIEKLLNDFKPNYYDYMAKKKFEAATDIHAFTDSFLSYLSLYRGEIAKFYLDEGAREMLFTALGPVGEAIRNMYGANIRRKMAWMKNPLNPNAINYYITSLPNQAAFKVLYIPAKATWGILARGGAPLISKATYQKWEKNPITGPKLIIKEGYFFSPALKIAQRINIFADGLEKFAGKGKTNQDFNKALDNLKRAKESKNITAIKDSRQKLRQLLNEHDGFYQTLIDKKTGKSKKISELNPFRRASFHVTSVSKAVFKKGTKNLGRRLKHLNRDPISGLFALLIGTLFDLALGLTLSLAKVVAVRALDLVSKFVPEVNTLRAQISEFFTSNRYISTASIGGTSIQSFVKGVVSPTTLTSGYLGYKFGSLLTPNLYFNLYGIPINVGGAIAAPIFAGTGAFYNTALKMSFTHVPFWVQKIQYWENIANTTGSLAQKATAETALNKMSLRGFRVGPFSKFANFLYKHPYTRLPINGFVVGDFLSSIIQSRFGWNPWITRFAFAGTDYLWQTKATWGNALSKTIGKFFSQQTWKFFGYTINNPLSLLNPNSLAFKLRGFIGRAFYIGDPFSNALLQRPWLSSLKGVLNSLKGIWSKAQPYLGNVFNPGFFMGFGLTSLLTPIMGGWAIIAGPIIGSATWMVGTKILSAAFSVPYAQFINSFNPLAFTGFFVSQLTGLVFFGTSIPFWYTAAWSLGLPLLGLPLQIIASTAGISVAQLLSGIIGGLTNGLITIASTTIAAGLAAWATVITIGSVLGLTIFSGYVLYSGFWVPMIEENQAFPKSSHFSINTDVQKIGPNKYKLCSTFDITENVFNLEKYLIHNFDFRQSSYLTVNLSDPDKVTDAWLGQKSLDYIAFTPDFVYPHYTIPLPLIDPPIVGYQQIEQLLETYLPTPDANIKNLQTLMYHDQSIVSSMSIYFDTFKELAQEYYDQTTHVIEEYQAQLALLKTQQKTEEIKQQIQLLDDFITQLGIAKKKITSQTIAQNIIKTNFYSLADSTLSIPEKDIIWNLLSNFFPNVFKNTSNFYIFPIGTNYKVCVDADYCYAIDPNNPPSCPTSQPITVCSTISYKPSFWSPNTAFAKSCYTFTP